MMEMVNIVIPVDYVSDLNQKPQSKSISEELREISSHLKEGLQGLNIWVQMHALLPGEGVRFFETASRELNRTVGSLSIAFSDLLAYQGQFPQPHDLGIALEMQETIQGLFRGEMREMTICKIENYSSSWSEMVSPREGIEWSPDLTQVVLGLISAESWQTVRTLLADCRSRLP